MIRLPRLHTFFAIACCAASLAACGSSSDDTDTDKSEQGTDTTAGPDSGGTPPKAPTVRVRALPTGAAQSLRPAAQVEPGDAVQFLVQPADAKSEPSARIVVPTDAASVLTVRATLEQDGAESDAGQASFRLPGNETGRLTQMRWTCYAPPTKSFCPLEAEVDGDELVLTAKRLRQDVPILVVGQISPK